MDNSSPENQRKKQGHTRRNFHNIVQYQWKKGQSGNPAGRPPGKSLKTFVREYLESLEEDDKLEFLKHVDPELVWKMAEGNPETKTDVTSKGERIMVVPPELINKNDPTSSTESNSEGHSQV